MNKLGHQAPKGYVYNIFNSVEIRGPFAYCSSHNFVFNSEKENRKLYNALPCFYTDNRYHEGSYNFYKHSMIHWTRFKNISLKSCIRKTLNCRNIPIGTIVKFKKSWYVPNKRKINLGYNFKIRKENKFDPQYEINSIGYSQNFNTCEFSKKLTDALRENGFIVYVNSINKNFLSGMMETAASFVGKSIEPDYEIGETAIAYGYDKMIGFSSGNNSLFGYSNGCDNILFDYYGQFDKWSRCNTIPKTTSIYEIVEQLKK